MRKSLLLFAAIFVFTTLNAQRPTIEKNLYGIQLGIIDLSAYNEYRLTSTLALKCELSFESGIWSGSWYTEAGFVIFPTISLEPKFYYNLDRRVDKGRNIKNNSANYLSLRIKYAPDLFAISNQDNVYILNQIQFIPTYGIRRNFAKQFNYEISFGYGYGTTIGYNYNTTTDILAIGLRVGYDF